MAEQPPALSVVIPTHNRCARLKETLAALTRQTMPASSFEVIVAMDATTDGTDAMLRSTAWPFALRSVIPEGRGAAAARNVGARATHGQRLVFLDDDILVDEGFLAAHHATSPADADLVIIGHSAPMVARRGWFEEGLLDWWERLFANMGTPGYRFGYTDLLSGNFSVDARLFALIGGFDEGFPCREDYELGQRLIEAGARFTFSPAGRGLHHDDSDLARSLRRSEAEGDADARIATKHPLLFHRVMVARLNAPFVSTAILRHVVFRSRPVGDASRFLALRMMGVLHWAGLRGPWESLHRAVRLYNYYRGAASYLGGTKALANLAEQAGPYHAAMEAAVFTDAAHPPLPERLALWEGDRGRIGAAFHPPARPPSNADFEPVSVGELDLSSWSLHPPPEELTAPARLLVRDGAQPLGWLHLPLWRFHDDRRKTIRAALSGNHVLQASLVRYRSLPEPAPPAARLPSITVVICTRDRTDNLRRCLAAVRQLRYHRFQILVVDNAPASDATQRLVSELPDVSYVREERPGLDWARNRGIMEARTDIVAFSDDDTRVDPYWLEAIGRAFAADGVMAVTGLVTPMKLDTPARRYFEDIYGGMGKGFVPSWTRRDQRGPRRMFWASGCGVGANMAFRRALFASIGPFDPALDVGTPTRGGGDIEMFHRVLAKGHMLVYEPSAIVWHEHRSDFPALARQLADNGSGFMAYLLTVAGQPGADRIAILRFALRDWLWGWIIARLVRPGVHRRALIFAELRGAIKGISAYHRARKEAAMLTREPATMTSVPGQAA